jgi:hypothetical protein
LGTVNQPEVSKAIAWSYGGLVILIATMAVAFALAGIFTPMQTGGIVATVVLGFVEAIMFLLLRSLYATRYVLTDKEIIVKTTKLIGGNKTIALKDIEDVEKTLIPFGIRLFGASFHGGYYQIPNLGRAFLAITNFHDGLLIKTKNGNYIITPDNPVDFKEAIDRERVR